MAWAKTQATNRIGQPVNDEGTTIKGVDQITAGVIAKPDGSNQRVAIRFNNENTTYVLNRSEAEMLRQAIDDQIATIDGNEEKPYAKLH
jgi:hypothetical protein